MSTPPLGPVIVGVDGSEAALAALDLAAEEAAARVTPLTVVHALDTPETPDGVAEAARETHARRLLSVAVERARVEHPALAVTAALAGGDPADALAHGALGASLLVLGHRARRAGVHQTSSVIARLLGRVPVPVLVHRPFDAPAPAGGRPVVVGLPDPAASDALLAFAFEEAALRGAPLVAMHVRPPAYGPDPYRQHDAGPEVEALAATVALWSEKYPEVPVRRVLRHGVDVAVAITAVSHTAQLVIVGAPRWLGRTGGSVINALVHRAGCPVVAVRLP
jgi:nucleotide-binding universal stress UspA family protein